jgi:hypothetical protein
MSDKIIQLAFPFAKTMSQPPKQPRPHVKYHADRDISSARKRRIPKDADLDEIFQYFIESQLEEMYEEARANEIRLSGYRGEKDRS